MLGQASWGAAGGGLWGLGLEGRMGLAGRWDQGRSRRGARAEAGAAGAGLCRGGCAGQAGGGRGRGPASGRGPVKHQGDPFSPSGVFYFVFLAFRALGFYRVERNRSPGAPGTEPSFGPASSHEPGSLWDPRRQLHGRTR